jgi:transposase InsO family protein
MLKTKTGRYFSMRNQRKAEEIAAGRVHLLSPLLCDQMDNAQARQIKARICEQSGISERTLRRYLSQYKAEGFSGLKPKSKGQKRSEDAIPANILEQAILLRREVPGRSVSQIINILEWDGLAEPGQIKRSTLQEKLAQRGYSSRHMRMYADSGVAARRFQKKYRNQLWHSDIKYGPYLPIGKNGAKKQVYLVTFVDDATRFVLHGQFYSILDQMIVEDAFRQAILKYGVPEKVYFDNGSQYRTKWMIRACAKMGIRLIYAKPYSPEATGKVERFNRVVDSFLSEAALEKPQTLERLNDLFQVWLTECYQNKAHSSLNGNISPETAFRSDKKALKFLEPETIANAFLHAEERKVDKAGCISFSSKKYEVGLNFIGCKVTVVYDPASIDEITIEYEGYAPFKARELLIGERTGIRPKLPEHLQPQPAESSRLLTAAGKKNKQRKTEQAPAVSYRTVRKGVSDNV